MRVNRGVSFFALAVRSSERERARVKRPSLLLQTIRGGRCDYNVKRHNSRRTRELGPVACPFAPRERPPPRQSRTHGCLPQRKPARTCGRTCRESFGASPSGKMPPTPTCGGESGARGPVELAAMGFESVGRGRNRHTLRRTTSQRQRARTADLAL